MAGLRAFGLSGTAMLVLTAVYATMAGASCGSDESANIGGSSSTTSGTGASGTGGNGQGGNAPGGNGQGGTGQGGTGQGGAGQGGLGQGGLGQGGDPCGGCQGGQLCDPQLGCVDCLTNNDCGAALPVCFNGTCVECAVNTDCPNNQTCSPVDNQCQPMCQNNADCQNGNANICDPNTGACVECINANDCSNGQLCSGGVCVDCITDADCGGGGNPYCLAGQCVECIFSAQCNNQQCINGECGG